MQGGATWCSLLIWQLAMLVSILFFLKDHHSPIRNGKPLGKDLGKDFDHNYHYISSLYSKLGKGILLFIIYRTHPTIRVVVSR